MVVALSWKEKGRQAMSDKIIYTKPSQFGGWMLFVPKWATQLAPANWEDAPDGQEVHVTRAQRGTYWRKTADPIEGFDLDTVGDDDPCITMDTVPRGLYRVTGRSTMVPVRLAAHRVVMRVSVNRDGMREVPIGDAPLELTGRIEPMGLGSMSYWLMGAAAAAGQSGVPYQRREFRRVEYGDYAVVWRRGGLSPAWLKITEH